MFCPCKRIHLLWIGIDRFFKTNFTILNAGVTWPLVQQPTRANTQQLKKTHANRQNTCKLRKHLHQFDNTYTAFRKCTENTETRSKYRIAANTENDNRGVSRTH